MSSNCGTSRVKVYLTAFLMLAGVVLGFANDFRVPEDFRNMQSAINAAQDGDRVLVSPGTYRGSGNVNLNFWGKRISLIGVAGRTFTIIELSGNSRGANFQYGETVGTSIRGFTFRSGSSATAGGAILVDHASPTITNCSFEFNQAPAGGAIAIYGGSPDIRLCEFTNNTAISGGAIYIASDAKVQLSGSTVKSNSSSQNGGGIAVNASSLTLARSYILTNSATGNGGGVSMAGGTLSVTDTYFQESVAEGKGGGVYVGASSTASFQQVSVLLNQAGSGAGGINIAQDGHASVKNSIVAFNRKDQASQTLVATNSFVPGLRTDATERAPVFENLGDFNARAGFMSSALYKATPQGGTTTTSDIEGNGRPTFDKADLGAYEHFRGTISWPNEIQATVPHDGNPHTNTAVLTFDGNAFTTFGKSMSYEWYLDGALLGNVPRLSETLPAGDYDLEFRATDSSGIRSSRLTKVHVIPEQNQAPNVYITTESVDAAYGDGYATLSVLGTDPEGDPISVVWQDGNGGYKRTFLLKPGTNNFTVTVTDSYGASKVESASVEFTRSDGPEVTLNGSKSMRVEAGTPFSDPGASARDLLSGIALQVTVAGSVDPMTIGDYLITYSASSGGMSATANRQVYVRDGIAPVVTLSGATTVYLLANTVFSDPGATAVDSFAGNLPVTRSGNLDLSTPGTYALSYKATDPSGNEDVKVRTVKVVASFNPIVTLNGANPMPVEVGSLFNDPGATAVAYSGATLPVTRTGSVDNLTIGNYNLTYKATDADGNVGSTTRSVAVRDTTKPVITMNGGTPMTVEVGSTFTDPGATAVDNYDGPVAVTATGIVTTSTIGTYTRTYQATDSSGNVATLVRTVLVAASVPPTITLTGASPMSLFVLTSFTDPGATAKDELGSSLTVSTSGSVNANVIGTYTRTYQATDRWSQTSTKTRTVNVVAQPTPPTVTILGANPTTVLTGTSYTDAGATAVDVLGLSLTVTATGAVNPAVAGTYRITYSATDRWGNTTTVKRTVTVQANTTPPTITILGSNPFYMQWKEKYTDAGATAVDVTGTSLTVTTVDPVTSNKPDTYYVTYTATDRWGVTATAQRTVVVIPPETPPTITILGANPMTVYLDDTFTDPGATAVNFLGEPLTVTATGAVNTSNPKAYTITYTTKDGYGNNAIADRIVNVSLPPAPTITLNGSDPMTVTIGSTFTDPGATAVDAKGTTLTVTASGTVTTGTVGSYTLTYTATDRWGTTATKTRTVTVPKPTTPPTITLNGSSPMSLAVGDTFTDPGATAVDILGATVAVSASGTVNTAAAGTYTRTYTATDRWGNVATKTRTVTVTNPTTPPTITILGENPLHVDFKGTFTDPGATAVDVLGASVTVSASGSVNVNKAGTYTRTYTATDRWGNTATATRSVIVDAAHNPPTITVLGTNPMTVAWKSVYTDAGATAVDDTGRSLTVTTSGSVNTNLPGTYTITYTATDRFGNTATATRTVTVSGPTTPPTITLLGANPMTVAFHGTFTDPGATAVDALGNSVAVVVTGSVNVNKKGSYTLTYTATDTWGNSASTTRTVTVQ